MNPSQKPLAPLRILRLIASPNGNASESLKLSERILHALTVRAGIRGIELTDIDLNTLSPVDATYAHALAHPSEIATEDQKGTLSRSDQMIILLNACDVLVIATPMHNYSVPSPLKAWIDHVVRVGKTFLSTSKDKVGTLLDRPVYVAVATGGCISGERARQPDFLRPYLSAVLKTIGLNQVHYFTVEGTAKGTDALKTAQKIGYDDVHMFFHEEIETRTHETVA
ncbi:NAD(P)H-dependent oxidoreductase [Pseudomonas atacamensis]|uniref:FMN-dependent NADH-azoreductase n=1 Tax=Pseudomonas TaxID=286 RepID=UPI0021602525|nr:NAD(P)H-dependent oxidoreductase [Pseudomonas atacamensis]UVL15470.1 NAD(P)H-dependent oxidoreductase [Pseudomonas atacamensis]